MGDRLRMLGLACDDELAGVRAAFGQYAPGDLESPIYLGRAGMGRE